MASAGPERNFDSQAVALDQKLGVLNVTGLPLAIQNEVLAQRINKMMCSIGGKPMLEQALRKGNITVSIENDNKITPSACWNIEKRIISIYIVNANMLSLEQKPPLSPVEINFYNGVIFELCNAANSLFESTPLCVQYACANDYAKDLELREFRTFQNFVRLWNRFIEFNNLSLQSLKVYQDHQFEEYFNEMCDRIGDLNSHANRYRARYQSVLAEYEKGCRGYLKTFYTDAQDILIKLFSPLPVSEDLILINAAITAERISAIQSDPAYEIQMEILKPFRDELNRLRDEERMCKEVEQRLGLDVFRSVLDKLLQHKLAPAILPQFAKAQFQAKPIENIPKAEQVRIAARYQPCFP